MLKIVWQFLDVFASIFGPEAMNLQFTAARTSKRHQVRHQAHQVGKDKNELSEGRYP